MKERFNNISLYRLIATVLVLLFHVFYICAIEDLAVATYFSKFLQGLTALSGFLMSQKTIGSVKGFYLERLKRILPPAIIVVLLVFIWDMIFYLFNLQMDFTSLFISYRAYNHSLVVQPGNYYFIAYILGCYLITPLLHKKNILTALTIAFVIFLETFTGRWIYPLYIITSYIIGYYVGTFGFKHYVGEYKKSDIIRFVIFALIAGLSLYFSLYLRTHKVFKGLNGIVTHMNYSIFGVAVMFLLLLSFKWLNKKLQFKVLLWSDKLAYIIFLLNQIFMVGATNIASTVSSIGGKIVLVFSFVIVFSIGVYFLNNLIDKKLFSKVEKK